MCRVMIKKFMRALDLLAVLFDLAGVLSHLATLHPECGTWLVIAVLFACAVAW